MGAPLQGNDVGRGTSSPRDALLHYLWVPYIKRPCKEPQMQFWRRLRAHPGAMRTAEKAQNRSQDCTTPHKWQPEAHLSAPPSFTSAVIPNSHLVLTLYFLSSGQICAWVNWTFSLRWDRSDLAQVHIQHFQAGPFSREREKSLRRNITHTAVHNRVHSSCLHLKCENKQLLKPSLGFFLLGHISISSCEKQPMSYSNFNGNIKIPPNTLQNTGCLFQSGLCDLLFKKQILSPKGHVFF